MGDVRDDDVYQEHQPPCTALAASISMRWLLLSVGEGVLYGTNVPCWLVSHTGQLKWQGTCLLPSL